MEKMYDKAEMITYDGKVCPTKVVQNLIAGKWKILILWYLRSRPRRFGELQKLLPEVSKGVLTMQLKQLESDKMIKRTVYDETPLKVVYSLTDIGESFAKVLDVMNQWGREYMDKINSK